jgi:multicomponent K+:H+ antiporter subunit D
MLSGLTERARTFQMRDADLAPLPEISYRGFDLKEPPDPHSPTDEVGVAIPAATAFLGLTFVLCVLLVAGLPPLSGFVAKFALLDAAFANAPRRLSWHVWLFSAAVLAIGFAAVIALTRVGMRLFWSVVGRKTPRLRIIEVSPIAFLLMLCVGLTAGVGPIMTYLESAARSLHSPEVYVRVVTSANTAESPP